MKKRNYKDPRWSFWRFILLQDGRPVGPYVRAVSREQALFRLIQVSEQISFPFSLELMEVAPVSPPKIGKRINKETKGIIEIKTTRKKSDLRLKLPFR